MNFKVVDSVYSDAYNCLAPACHSITFNKLNNGKFSEIKFIELFNDKIALLEQEINRKSKIQLSELKNDPDEKCYYQKSVNQNHSFRVINAVGYQLNEIDFFNLREKGVTFRTNVDYDNSDCDGFKRGAGMLFISFTIDELSSYFAE